MSGGVYRRYIVGHENEQRDAIKSAAAISKSITQLNGLSTCRTRKMLSQSYLWSVLLHLQLKLLVGIAAKKTMQFLIHYRHFFPLLLLWLSFSALQLMFSFCRCFDICDSNSLEIGSQSRLHEERRTKTPTECMWIDKFLWAEWHTQVRSSIQPSLPFLARCVLECRAWRHSASHKSWLANFIAHVPPVLPLYNRRLTSDIDPSTIVVLDKCRYRAGLLDHF